MTARADSRDREESLDWLPDVAVRSGRALQPVLVASGGPTLSELAGRPRVRRGPPVVASARSPPPTA